MQREEKRLQKIQEKSRHQETIPEPWADKFVGHKPQQLPAQTQDALSGANGVRSNSAPQVPPMSIPGLDLDAPLNGAPVSPRSEGGYVSHFFSHFNINDGRCILMAGGFEYHDGWFGLIC